MNDTAGNAINDEALIERYLQLREYVTAEKDKYDKQMKPYMDGMDQIEAEFLRRLNERVPNVLDRANSATNSGTAYRTRNMKPKVVDPNAFLKFCFDNWSAGGSEMLRVSPVFDPLREWLDKNVDPVTNEQHFPPGLEVGFTISVNIRKS